MPEPRPVGRDNVLYYIVCGAPPAAHAEKFVAMAKHAGWDVCVVATPMATRFFNPGRLAARAGRPVRHDFKHPGEDDLFPRPNAIAVAPATFNTVNKLVAGIADTLALALLCEYVLLPIPLVMAPKVNPLLAAHPQYSRSISELRRWGVRVLDPPTAGISAASLAFTAVWERVIETLPALGRAAARDPSPVDSNKDA